ncbi:MAG TPA: hypothetical protein VF058_02505, partial [Actinomycetota bacterium]
MRLRYSRWDGSQDPLGPELSAADILEAISDDLLEGAGPEAALRGLARRGIRGRITGTEALRARLRDARRREQERLDLEGPLREVAEELEEILELERSALSLDSEDDARMRESFIESLPRDPAGRIRELREYRFTDAVAQRKFDELMAKLAEQVLGAYFRQLAGGMRDLTPEQLARIKDMLAELNAMIEARDRGEPYDFQGFMERYGDMFPGNPRTLDELLEAMAQRMAAMSRLMASLSPDQQRELRELAEQVMRDMDLAFEADRLGSHLA